MDHKFFDPNREEDDFQMRIDANGQWYHRGTPISRDRLSKLFSTALHYNKDTNEYWLITPHEQGRVDVEGVPFVIIDYHYDDKTKTLSLTSNLNHEIKPDAENPIKLNDDNIPCVIAVNNVPARLNRMVREKLIDIALADNGYNDDDQILYLKANGYEHSIARS